ncbi:uncharacterized protein LOC142665508 [Rhinoderma darwinii]|uniref:uncharacterized protein LOC142665508 n=1 Tax=Rhinoderma darwinii TaxID=43563 RepID=UPI003F661D61
MYSYNWDACWSSDYDSTWEDEESEPPKKKKPKPKNQRNFGNRAARDMQNYRHGYGEPNPYTANYPVNQEFMPNLEFYQNKMEFEPHGVTIEEFHLYWRENYNELEENHSFIQWLFPLRERGVNRCASPLTLAEIQMMRADKDVLRRFLVSYRLMLGFYGIQLLDEKTGEVSLAKNWRERFRNLNNHGHNNLRITRILKCLGEMGFEHFQAPLVWFFLEETLCNNYLPNVARSVLDYFIFTVKGKQERRKLVQFAWENYKSQEPFIWGPVEKLQKITSNDKEEKGNEGTEDPDQEPEVAAGGGGSVAPKDNTLNPIGWPHPHHDDVPHYSQYQQETGDVLVQGGDDGGPAEKDPDDRKAVIDVRPREASEHGGDRTSSGKQTTQDNSSEKQTTEDNSSGKQTTQDNSSEKQTTEDNSSGKQTTEDNSSEKQTTEDNSSEKQTTQDNSSEKQTTEDNSSGKQTTQDNSSEKQTTEDNSSEKQTTEDNSSEKQTTEDNSSEKHTTEDNSSEKQTTQDNSSEKQTTEDNSSGKQTTEDNSSEKQTTEDNSSEKHTTEDNSSEKQTTQDNSSEKQTTEDNSSRKQTTEDNSSEKQTTEDNSSEKQTTEDHSSGDEKQITKDNSSGNGKLTTEDNSSGNGKQTTEDNSSGNGKPITEGTSLINDKQKPAGANIGNEKLITEGTSLGNENLTTGGSNLAHKALLPQVRAAGVYPAENPKNDEEKLLSGAENEDKEKAVGLLERILSFKGFCCFICYFTPCKKVPSKSIEPAVCSF